MTYIFIEYDSPVKVTLTPIKTVLLLSEIRITKKSSHGHIEYVISVISY